MPPTVGLICPNSERLALHDAFDGSNLTITSDLSEPASLAGVLYVPGSLTAREELAALSSRLQSLLPENHPFMAVLTNAAISPSDVRPFLPVSSCKNFIQLTQMKLREQSLRQEAKLRAESFAKLSGRFAALPVSSDKRKRVLYLGPPSVFFLKCQNAFQSRGWVFDTALTERSAFDLINMCRPDLLLVHVEQGQAPLEFLDHVDGRNDLAPMPVLAVTSEPYPDTALAERASVVLNIRANDVEQLFEVYSRIQPAGEPDLLTPSREWEIVRDRYTGAFNRAFAEVHLESQLDAAKSAKVTPVIAQLFPIVESSGEAIDAKQFAAFSNLLLPLLRQEDFLARLDWSRFLISFSGANRAQAEASLARVRSIMETTQLSGSAISLTFSYQLVPVSLSVPPKQAVRAILAAPQKTNSNQSAVA